MRSFYPLSCAQQHDVLQPSLYIVSFHRISHTEIHIFTSMFIYRVAESSRIIQFCKPASAFNIFLCFCSFFLPGFALIRYVYRRTFDPNNWCMPAEDSGGKKLLFSWSNSHMVTTEQMADQMLIYRE